MLEIIEFIENPESDDDDLESNISDYESDNDESECESSDYEPPPEKKQRTNRSKEPTKSNQKTYPLKKNINKKTSSGKTQTQALKTKKQKTDDRNWMNGSFYPQTFDFDESKSGVSSRISNSEVSPLHLFEFFFDQSLMSKIIEETNKYNQTIVVKSTTISRKHQKAWIDINNEEMFCFFAIVLLMSAVKKGRIKDYWSKDQLIATPIFGKIMARDRFLAIMRALHFNDNENQPVGDRLYKLRPVIDNLNEKFCSCINAYQNLCIDESLMPWKGKLVFKQYIPKKRHRFGVKLFVICDCKTGIVLGFIIYVGSETEIENWEDLGVSGSVVMTLMKSYLEKGHNLYVDNWYTSVKLFEELHNRKTGACGTIKSNRIGFPKFESLNAGEVVYLHTEKLLATKWRDKRDVHMLSSIQKDGKGSTGKEHYKTKEPIKKPLSVIAYNANMGAVDKSDMQLSFVECIRKTIKWYKKFFFHLLDLSVLNSSILYGMKTGKKGSLGSFRNDLVRQMLYKYCKHLGTVRTTSSGPHPIRLVARHFPSKNGKKRQRNCVVCSASKITKRKRSASRYECADCDVGLCVTDCFKQYHTLLHF